MLPRPATRVERRDDRTAVPLRDDEGELLYQFLYVLISNLFLWNRKLTLLLLVRISSYP
jgi:hypothetical protein